MANLNNLDPNKPPRNIFQPVSTQADINRANAAGCQAVVWVILVTAILILIILGAMLP